LTRAALLATTRAVTDIPIIPLDAVDMRIDRAPWAFAVERRAEIDAHFAALRRAKPQLWNGRVLLLRSGDIAGGLLRGAYLETDFASFMAWRDWGFPDRTIRNCFPMAALRASDGAFLLGEMAPYTATAGHVYFPAGTPDPNDIVGEAVDLEAGVMRELTEETGLTAADVAVERGWYAVPVEPRIALMKVMHSSQDSQALRARMLAFLGTQREPEFSDIRIVRREGDFHPMMPPYVAAFLRNRLGLAKPRGEA
jgi:8-oxo-dGTP pyrophosphatase MutT (NUDIX family)